MHTLSQLPFSSLKLGSAILKNLSSLGYEAMTPIQAQSLPHILSGKDVIAQGKTGSGKTAAFGLGILEKLSVKRFCVQALVLCPTRELADQVTKEVRRLARATHNIKVLTLCGGMPLGPQIGSLEHGAHIVVGTPGRIEELLRKGSLKLGDLNTFVLDEADRMLDMGFQASLDAIIEYLPEQRQTMLFSATYPDQIRDIAGRIMIDPLVINSAATHDQDSIKQIFFKISDEAGEVAPRLTALRLLLLAYRPDSALVFCNTRRETQELADQLSAEGFSALALHGDLEQRDRDQTLVRFTNRSTSILVATDVAARGLDIEALDVVIIYQLARETEVHVHRIGRTGRAGSKGLACTLYSDKESYKLGKLAEYLHQEMVTAPLPSLSLLKTPAYKPPMLTLQIDGGKKQKVRPGDILGALTGKGGIVGSEVGKISVFDNWAYVAVKREVCQAALSKLGQGQLKGRSFRVRRIGD